MSDAPEKQAIISGIGISRIGRKTDFGHLDLTTESASAAIADAGLRPEDIDGIATMGDTPPAEVAQHLGGRIGSIPMVGTGGLLASGDGRVPRRRQRRCAPRARVPHREDDGRLDPAAERRRRRCSATARSPTIAARGQRRGRGRRHGQRDGRHGAAAHVRRVLGGELARDARAAPHVPLRHDEGATRRARRQQPAQRRAQPAPSTASR